MTERSEMPAARDYAISATDMIVTLHQRGNAHQVLLDTRGEGRGTRAEGKVASGLCSSTFRFERPLVPHPCSPPQPSPPHLPPLLIHRLAYFPGGFLFLFHLALVVLLFAARHSDLNLRSPLLEVKAQRDQRVALLCRLAGEFGDLALMEQKLAGAFRLVIETISHGVFRDIAAD